MNCVSLSQPGIVRKRPDVVCLVTAEAEVGQIGEGGDWEYVVYLIITNSVTVTVHAYSGRVNSGLFLLYVTILSEPVDRLLNSSSDRCLW